MLSSLESPEFPARRTRGTTALRNDLRLLIKAFERAAYVDVGPGAPGEARERRKA